MDKFVLANTGRTKWPTKDGKYSYGSISQSVLLQDHAQSGQQNVAEGQIHPFKLLFLPAVELTFFPELLMWQQRTGCVLCALAVRF